MHRKNKKEKRFYVDYLFAKPELVKSFEIGDFDEYIEYSDHMPLIFEIDI